MTEEQRSSRDTFYRGLCQFDQDGPTDILGALTKLGFIHEQEDGRYTFPWGETSSYDEVAFMTFAMGIQIACEEGKAEMCGFDENGEPLYRYIGDDPR